MPRPADRRGQGTAEWITVVLAVGAVLGTSTWLGAPQPLRIARALVPGATPRPLADQTVAAAVRGEPGALSPLGIEAQLREEDPATADERVVAAVARVMREHHRAWGEDLRIIGPPLRGQRATSTVRTSGPVQARVVSFADERDRTRGPSAADRAGAAGANLAWQSAGAMAQRIARPLGLAVGAVQLAAGLLEGDDALPAGVRAGDIVVCRTATIDIRGGAVPRPVQRHGWRVGVLRAGRLILDAVAAENPCAAPAGD